MKIHIGFLRLTGSLGLLFWLVLSLSACSTGGKTTESASPTLSEATQAPATVPTSEPTAQETLPALLATDTPAEPAETVPAPSPTAPQASGDPLQAVLSAMHAMKNAGPYRVNATATSDETTTKWTTEVILPDRFHLVLETGEFIIVGDKTYTKQGDLWVEFPVDIGSMVSSLIGRTDEEAEKGISDVQRIGPDTVKGDPATVYQYRSTAELEGIEVSSLVKLWVRDSDGLPVRQEIDGESGGVQSTTIQEIEYDASITIEAPPGY